MPMPSQHAEFDSFWASLNTAMGLGGTSLESGGYSPSQAAKGTYSRRRVKHHTHIIGQPAALTVASVSPKVKELAFVARPALNKLDLHLVSH